MSRQSSDKDMGGRRSSLLGGCLHFFAGGAPSEEGIQDWERALEDASAGTGESILLLSRDLTVQWANRLALKQTGYVSNEILGRLCHEVTHLFKSPCEPPLHSCPVPELRRTGEAVTAIHVHPDRTGEELLVEVCAYPIEDERGELARIVHVSRGVTEPERVREALRSVRRELENRVERQLQRKNVYRLTFRELTVLSLVAGGMSDRDIATILDIKPLTAQKHVANILARMRAASRTEAAVRAVREGLVF